MYRKQIQNGIWKITSKRENYEYNHSWDNCIVKHAKFIRYPGQKICALCWWGINMLICINLYQYMYQYSIRYATLSINTAVHTNSSSSEKSFNCQRITVMPLKYDRYALIFFALVDKSNILFTHEKCTYNL